MELFIYVNREGFCQNKLAGRPPDDLNSDFHYQSWLHYHCAKIPLTFMSPSPQYLATVLRFLSLDVMIAFMDP